MYLHGRRSCRSRQSRVYKFDPPPTAAAGECNRACSDCRAATAEAELVPQIRLGGGFRRNPQGLTVLDYRRCKSVYNHHFLFAFVFAYPPLVFMLDTDRPCQSLEFCREGYCRYPALEALTRDNERLLLPPFKAPRINGRCCSCRRPDFRRCCHRRLGCRQKILPNCRRNCRDRCYNFHLDHC